MARDNAHLAGPDDAGGDGEVILPQRQQLAAHHARQTGPADDGKEHGNGEVGLDHRPVARHGGGERHPQRKS